MPPIICLPPDSGESPSVAVIGGGPAGLMAAEVLIQAGVQVDLYDAMPSVGRKLLVAGKGGLNLTHSEPREQFLARYGARRAQLEPLLNAFGPDDLRQWVHELGFDTFVGTSGRVFPVGLKASPLLRAWLQRLRQAGVALHVRHAWRGWSEEGCLCFETPEGEKLVRASATVLALGGGSWARLGATGAWAPLLVQRGVEVAPLKPSNCGFDVGWTEHFRARFAGQPVKPVVLVFADSKGSVFRQQGEFVVTANGVEGSLIYAVSARLRDEIEAKGSAVIQLDLAPDWSRQRLVERLSQPRGARSVASHLKRAVGLQGVKAGLLWEFVPKRDWADPNRLAAAIKELPVPLIAPRPLDEAISSAGGVTFEALDERLMLRSMPGVFCAGEMLDWEAPTGGYLLTACCASGRAAGRGALAWLDALYPTRALYKTKGEEFMATTSDGNTGVKKIVVQENGPYVVHGGIPLVRKTQVVSEHGEPLTWKKDGTIETGETYDLCRCGHSATKPFCDMTHLDTDFDGAETADTRATAERQKIYVGDRIVVKRDHSLCAESGFCGNRLTNIRKMVPETGDSLVRAQIMAMVERCPSGSYAYALEEGGPDIEPDFPQQIAVTTEITSDGPIDGPLWVTGKLPIERADGQPFETRNRVTLCGCGRSKTKPLCDGTHRTAVSSQ